MRAAEVIPPKPPAYFNDYAGVVSKEAARRFNEQLAQFERDTSNQIVVAIYPKMQSDSDIADYAQRVAQNWGIGKKDRKNGVLLLVFPNDRKMSLQVGYGLEGALPDAIAYDIRANRISPHFRNNDYEGGLAAGINGIIQAIRGEYKGSGRTVRETGSHNNSGGFWFLLFVVIVLFFLIVKRGRRAGYRYSSFGGPFIGGWSSGSGGGWSSGGGSSGFSGGGGSFGGGGSSGSW